MPDDTEEHEQQDGGDPTEISDSNAEAARPDGKNSSEKLFFHLTAFMQVFNLLKTLLITYCKVKNFSSDILTQA